MTGEATLDFLGRLMAAASIPLARRPARPLELSPADLRRKVREYSTGMKRKLGIVQAFQADAPLLILDEPTEGLDPLMQEALYGLLAEDEARGRTVFMSSHVLPEVERVSIASVFFARGDWCSCRRSTRSAVWPRAACASCSTLAWQLLPHGRTAAK